ncbi:hypothetical protein IWW36_000260 [Coemansia brasiliensis]|uniref:Uncharacterized protein n=1 Tax=Coemansia brasiliensis TaxID=2650707 RepID=A0A9W8IG05_9FUNG|nr:hypothetical protein IWW36_000260 [Coemansia brasiliensis]
MNDITISGFGHVFQSLKDVKLPSTKQLTIFTVGNGNDHPRTAFYINRLVSNANKAEKVYLKIDKNTSVLKGDLTCTAITSLDIESAISIETLLSLVEVLSNLVDLSCLVEDDVQHIDLSEADKNYLEPYKLIQSANCIQFVRDLRISIYYLTSPAAGLTQVAAVLSKLPCDNQVQSLCFLLTHGVSDFSNQIFEDEQLAQAAKDIAMVFPRITRLKFDGSFTTDATKKISSYITKQYAHQLERLESEYAIGNENKFPALKYASINVFGENHFEIPQMSADHLEYLELFNLPLNCSWDSFKSSDGDIEFSRLAKLFISYTSFPDESQQYVFSDYRLIFPKLDTFSINGVITKHSVLSQMVFPPQMDKLFINCHGNMFQNLKNTRLPSTKLLVLSTSLEHDDNPRTVSYMNQLVSNAAGTESVHLWINKSTCTVSVGDITCNAITKLRIEVPIDIETVLSLIDTLSNLEIMDITCLTGDHTH